MRANRRYADRRRTFPRPAMVAAGSIRQDHRVDAGRGRIASLIAQDRADRAFEGRLTTTTDPFLPGRREWPGAC